MNTFEQSIYNQSLVLKCELKNGDYQWDPSPGPISDMDCHPTYIVTIGRMVQLFNKMKNFKNILKEVTLLRFEN